MNESGPSWISNRQRGQDTRFHTVPGSVGDGDVGDRVRYANFDPGPCVHSLKAHTDWPDPWASVVRHARMGGRRLRGARMPVMRRETRTYYFGGRDKSIYKLRLHKWAMFRKVNMFTVSMAQWMACETDRIYELMCLARKGAIEGKLPSRPTREVWLSMYRDHHRVFRGVCDAMPSLLGPGEQAQASIQDAQALSNNTRGKRDEAIAEMNKHWKDNRVKWVRFGLHCAWLEYRNRLKERRRDRFGCDDAGPDDLGLKLPKSPELQFYIKAVLPSLALYQQLPWTLYRRARRGDPSAIETLIRVDDMVIHDPDIERWMNAVDGSIRRERHTMVRLWMTKALNHGQFSMMQVKQVMCGLISAFANRFGHYLDFNTLKLYSPQLTTANIVDLYHAVQQDRRGVTMGVFDPDFHDIQIESVERRVREYRRRFEWMLPGGGQKFR